MSSVFCSVVLPRPVTAIIRHRAHARRYPLAKLKELDPFLHKVITIQKIVRSHITRRRVASERTQRKLEQAIRTVRRNRNAQQLLEAIQEALEQGIDDESDVYFEAGELIQALEDPDTADVVASRGGMEWTKMWDGTDSAGTHALP